MYVCMYVYIYIYITPDSHAPLCRPQLGGRARGSTLQAMLENFALVYRGFEEPPISPMDHIRIGYAGLCSLICVQTPPSESTKSTNMNGKSTKTQQMSTISMEINTTNMYKHSRKSQQGDGLWELVSGSWSRGVGATRAGGNRGPRRAGRWPRRRSAASLAPEARPISSLLKIVPVKIA